MWPRERHWLPLGLRAHVNGAAERSYYTVRREDLPPEEKEARPIRCRGKKRTGETRRIVHIGTRVRSPSEAGPRVQSHVSGVVGVDRGGFHFLGSRIATINALARDDLAVRRVKDALGSIGGC